MAVKIRFYLDENVNVAIAKELLRQGIDVVTVRDLNLLGDADVNHFRRATEMGCVICTHDADYIELAGIVFGQQDKHNVGDWVKFLLLVTEIYSPDDMQNRVEYLRKLPN